MISLGTSDDVRTSLVVAGAFTVALAANRQLSARFPNLTEVLPINKTLKEDLQVGLFVGGSAFIFLVMNRNLKAIR